jgi:hypothetical protein
MSKSRKKTIITNPAASRMPSQLGTFSSSPEPVEPIRALPRRRPPLRGRSVTVTGRTATHAADIASDN